jgi:hypothetical protein
MQTNQAISTHHAALTGSVSDIMRTTGRTLEEIVPTLKAVILYDVSSSMGEHVYTSEGTFIKHTRALETFEDLQARWPGQILLISFGSVTSVCLDGIPPAPSGMTYLAPALDLARDIAAMGAKTIIVSDGEATDASSVWPLAETWPSPIDTVFIGPVRSHGEQFLQRISNMTKGKSHTVETEILMLESHIAGLLPPPSGAINL